MICIQIAGLSTIGKLILTMHLHVNLMDIFNVSSNPSASLYIAAMDATSRTINWIEHHTNQVR